MFVILPTSEQSNLVVSCNSHCGLKDLTVTILFLHFSFVFSADAQQTFRSEVDTLYVTNDVEFSTFCCEFSTFLLLDISFFFLHLKCDKWLFWPRSSLFMEYSCESEGFALRYEFVSWTRAAGYQKEPV